MAYNKDTTQISTDSGGVSSRGVDGQRATCTHTKLEDKPWWRVDLVEEEPVSEVYIVSGGTEQLSDIEIRVGRLPYFFCYYFPLYIQMCKGQHCLIFMAPSIWDY